LQAVAQQVALDCHRRRAQIANGLDVGQIHLKEGPLRRQEGDIVEVSLPIARRHEIQRRLGVGENLGGVLLDLASGVLILLEGEGQTLTQLQLGALHFAPRHRQLRLRPANVSLVAIEQGQGHSRLDACDRISGGVVVLQGGLNVNVGNPFGALTIESRFGPGHAASRLGYRGALGQNAAKLAFPGEL